MKSSALGLAIAAIAFGASTLYLAVQLNEERAQADKVATTMAALNARIAELEKAREQRFATSGVFGGDALAQGGMPMTPPPPPPDKGEVELKTGESGVVFNSTPPPRSEAFEKMMRTNMRANNKRMYADVGEKLGLSKEDTNKLINMLSDQQVENMTRMRDVNAADPAERQRMWEDARREDQAELDAFLGASKAAELRDYQDTIPARQEMDQLTRQLEGADANLTDDQQKRMLAALIEERKRVPMPQFSENTTPEEYTKAYSDWQKDYSERVEAQAHSILNTEQMTAYTEYQQWQTEMREQMATRRAIRGIRGGPGGNVTFMQAAPIAGGEVAILTAPAPPPEEKPRKPR
jgi:outer membrane murein-binding lipoprotein Lpp